MQKQNDYCFILNWEELSIAVYRIKQRGCFTQKHNYKFYIKSRNEAEITRHF